MIKVELQNVFGNDFQVAESAWTSSLNHSKKKTKSEEDVKKLINFLADNKHSTPFESIIFRFWMKIPIVTDRQIMTHRLQSTSGMSGRYRTMPNEFMILPDDINDILNNMNFFKAEKIKEEYKDICNKSNEVYNEWLKDFKTQESIKSISNNEYKRLREFFRGVLPQNNMTERVSLMNLRAWANFYKLRSSKHAQPEIQEVAKQMFDQIKQCKEIKYCIEALERNNWVI